MSRLLWMLPNLFWINVNNYIPTTPKLKTSDLGVICPLRASGAMYAQVPTILSVIMVVDVRVADALVSPKSDTFATNSSSNRMFPLAKTVNLVVDEPSECF